jgi:CO/xanthine dehydrogenase Mo-binding subunit
MNIPDDGRAERLAPWIRALPLDQQVLITGTTLVLEEINTRRGSSLPYPVDEVALRETADPRQAAHLARAISAQYAGLEPVTAPDGIDENLRISNITKVMAETIDRNYPASDGSRWWYAA